jgi:hypothetical protein
MVASASTNTTHSVAQDAPDERFAANDVRLSPRGWLLAGALTLLALWLIPLGWQIIEPLGLDADYRVPFRLGNDYWNYERTSREVCHGDEVLLVGDSVFWGHYVDTDETLSHYLNEASQGDNFANLGVDGIHPVALAGLVRHYGGAIRNKRVIVNCNLLWMSSPRHDLSSDKETPFNHPALVPQFAIENLSRNHREGLPRADTTSIGDGFRIGSKIPCYRADLSERLGIVVARRFKFLGWADHIRIAYFNNDDLATWTLEHPHENPLSQVTLSLPSPDEPPSPEPDARPWDEKQLRRVTPEWVPLEESLQWQFFRQTIEVLQDRGNQVFVMVGPLNEHMLTEEGLAEYNEQKQAVAAWHQQQGIPHAVPAALPSEAYADLSHPTAEGYRLLAERLTAAPTFREFTAN